MQAPLNRVEMNSHISFLFVQGPREKLSDVYYKGTYRYNKFHRCNGW